MSDPTPSTHRAGYAAFVGKPNVGKSTLLNLFLGQKVAAVSPRPQTTRDRQLGILTTETMQVIFVDTPGIHLPRHKLGDYMNQVATEALEEADIVIWVVDGSEMPTEEDELIASRLNALRKAPLVIIALNKVDRIKQEDIAQMVTAYGSLYAPGRVMPVSASSGYGHEVLLEAVTAALPVGEAYYPEDQVTDLYERQIAADLIREAALIHLREEVPHGIVVRIDEFKERSDDVAYIAATLFVERESHKGIVIGRGGEMLKRIGSNARLSIEEMSGRKVFLELRVKVSKNWRNDDNALRTFGYTTEKE